MKFILSPGEEVVTEGSEYDVVLSNNKTVGTITCPVDMFCFSPTTNEYYLEPSELREIAKKCIQLTNKL